jgi:hypothetical protein
MPKVPTYDSPKVQEQGLPNVRVSPDAPAEAFGAGRVGAQLKSVGESVNTAAKVYHEEKKSADDLRVKQAYAQALEAKQKLLHDPKEGALSRRGQNALGVLDEYTPKFDERLDEIEDGLSNGEQKSFFKQMRLSMRGEFNDVLHRHSANEYRVVEDETTKATLSATQQDAILNFRVPGKIQQSLTQQEGMIKDLAHRRGLGSEWEQQQLTQVRHETHAGVMKRLLANGEDLSAQSYYQKYKGQFDATKMGEIENALEIGSVRGQSQRIAMNLTAKYSPETESEALKELDSIKDPKVKDATRERVLQRFQDMRNGERHASEHLFNRLATVIESTKSRDNIPPDEWAQLTMSQRSALDSRIKALREGVQPETSWGDYYDLMQKASTGSTRGEFMRINLYEGYREKLDDTRFVELVKLQKDMREGKGDADKVLDGYRSNQQIVNDAMTEAGYDVSPKPGTETAAKVNQIRQRVDEEVMRIQKQNGRKATNQEVQDVVNMHLMKGITKKSTFWFDTEKRKFELEPGESFVEVDEEEKKRGVPPTVRRDMERSLKRKLSDQEAWNYYMKYLKARGNK